MVLRRWADDRWIPLSLGVDAALFVAAVLLWRPGTRPFAGLAFVLALVLPLALLTVAFTERASERQPTEGAPERRSGN